MKQTTLTAQGLVEFSKRCKITPHVYLWDGNGEYITDDLLDRLSAKYPDWYTPERLSLRRQLANRGIRGWDCIGMIKSYVWGDYSDRNPSGYDANTNFYTRTLILQPLVKGSIDELPETPGIVLWKKGHVGVYIGDGQVIECTSRAYGHPDTLELIGGVQQRPITDCAWECWLEYPGIQY